MARGVALTLSASAFVLVLATPGASQDAGRLYDDNCSACHTIGGGAQAGPDLKDVTSRRDREWLVRFMLDPDELVEHGDPQAVRLVREWDGNIMPETEGLTPALAEQLLQYIEQQSGARTVPHMTAPIVDRPFSEAELRQGRSLFNGGRALAARGPACLPCHQLSGVGGLGGGRLGPDLTRVHERLRGRRGLDTWLANPPTPVMRAIYRGAPLDQDERIALVALFEDALTRDTVAARSGAGRGTFLLLGVAAALAGLGAAGVTWSRRFRAVRRPFVTIARTGAPGESR